MSDPLVSVDEFLLRFDERFVAQLTSEDGTEADRDRVGAALVDATAELAGYLPRIPVARRPSVDTQRVHCIKIATYLLTQNRPGKEFESIRNGYTDTIKYYTDLITAVETTNASPSLGMSSCSPSPAFTGRSLKGLVP